MAKKGFSAWVGKKKMNTVKQEKAMKKAYERIQDVYKDKKVNLSQKKQIDENKAERLRKLKEIRERRNREINLMEIGYLQERIALLQGDRRDTAEKKSKVFLSYVKTIRDAAAYEVNELDIEYMNKEADLF